MIDITGKTAVITGGSRGIGAATADMFAKAGAEVAINYNNRADSANEVKTRIESLGGKCFVAQADLADYNQVDNFIDNVLEFYGKIDILVNNHGIWTDGRIDDMSLDTWAETMNVNLNSVYYLCRKVVPVMKDRKNGIIINVSSTAGQRGEAEHSHYAATKGAIIAFTKSLAAELAPEIRVNSVAPGWVDTDMCTGVFADEKVRQNIVESIPVKRIPVPEDIAGPILFLASDLARHINGEILNVNGGSVLCG